MKKIWKSLILCLAILPCILIFTACSKSYTVTFDSNGGSKISSVSVEENNLVSKPDDPIKDGYSFNGWFLGETEWDFEENHVNKDITLTANWIAVEYSITYHLGDSTNNIGNPNTYTIESETIELLSPTLANHQFLGWYDNESFNGNAITHIESGSFGNINLYARFVFDNIDVNGFRQIKTTEDFCYYLNEDHLSDKFMLISDIDLENREWTPIGTFEKPFNGEFNGNGHSISNYKISQERLTNGLFGYAGSSSIIKNLKVNSANVNYNYSSVSSTSIVGLLVGGSEGKIIKCSADGIIAINSTSSIYCGGLVGTSTNLLLECSSSGSININVNSNQNNSLITVGGLVAEAVKVDNCYSTTNILGKITYSSQDAIAGSFVFAGGLLGSLDDGDIFNSYSSGNLTATSQGNNNACVYAGGLVGFVSSADENNTIKNCFVNGNITVNESANSSAIGSLIGILANQSKPTITNCHRNNNQIITHNSAAAVWSSLSDSSKITNSSSESIKTMVNHSWDDAIWNKVTSTPTLDSNLSDCIVCFDSQGGTAIPCIDGLTFGDKITKPSDPTQTGFIFKGWYYNGLKWDFETDTIERSMTLVAEWEAVETTISFYLNGGSEKICDDLVVRYGANYTLPDTITFNTPLQLLNGHYLVSSINLTSDDKVYDYEWYFNGSKTTNGTWYLLENNVSLYLTMTPKQYTITYDLDGGTNNANNKAYYTAEDVFLVEKLEDLITFSEPTKLGYGFVGWHTMKNFTNDTNYINNLYGMFDITNEDWYDEELRDFTLYAEFGIINYAIAYETEDENQSLPIDSYTVLDKVTLPVLTRKGFKFLGWKTNVEDKTYITEILVGTTGNLKLYAGWEIEIYSILYNLDGGTNSQYNEDTYTVKDTITLYNPTKEHYDFVAWKLSNGTTISKIEAGTIGHIQLAALWIPTQYTITYIDAGNHSNPSQYDIEDSSITLQSATKPHYVFKGWYADSTFETLIEKIITKTPANLTIYAKWETVPYVVNYVLNGGTNNKDNPQAYNIEEENKTLLAPSKRGYEFNGWYLDNYYNTPVSEIDTSKGQEITIYAKWKIIDYTITYELKGGKNNVDNPDTYNIEDSAITLLSSTKDHYDFVAWFADKELTQEITSIDTQQIKDIIIYAKYTPSPYTITYTLGEGIVEGNPVTYNIETENFELNNPTKVGYNFIGWSGTGLDENSMRVSISKGSFGNRTYTANWEKVAELANFNFRVNDGEIIIDEVVDKTVEELVVPSFVSQITLGALNGCDNLQSLSIPFIGTDVNHDKQLIQLFGADELPYTLTKIEITNAKSVYVGALQTGISIEEIALNEGLEIIYDGAFAACLSLNKINMPSTLKEIRSYAFSGCDVLQTVEIADISKWVMVNIGGKEANPITYAKSMYVDNNLVTNFVLPNVEEVKPYVFYNLASIKTLTLPTTLKTIGNFAFYGCTNLKEIVVPDNVTTIGEGSFGATSKLEKITLPFVGKKLTATSNSEETVFGYIFSDNYDSNKAGLTKTNQVCGSTYYEAYIPDSLKEINITRAKKLFYGAFSYLTQVEKINISNECMVIESKVFINCTGLTEFIIPSSVVTIKTNAFYGCSGIYSIIVPATIKNMETDVFVGGCYQVFVESEELPTAWAEDFAHTSVYLYSENPQPRDSVSSGILELSHYWYYHNNEVVIWRDVVNVSTLRIESYYSEFSPTVHLRELSKTGYEFEGWYLDSDYTKPVNEETKLTGEYTYVYEKWNIINYDITYHNLPDSSSYPKTYTIESPDITFAIPLNNGYSFKGWYADENYTNALTTIKKGSHGNIDLYAKWEIINYSITYVNIDTATNNNVVRYNIENLSTVQTYELQAVELEYYDFEGWYLDDEFTTQVTTFAEVLHKDDLKDITLHAKWAIKTDVLPQVIPEYTITFIFSAMWNNNELLYNTEVHYATYTIESHRIEFGPENISCFEFIGFYEDSNYTQPITYIPSGSIGNKTIYLLFEPIEYTITYEFEEGTNNNQNPTTFTIEDEKIILNNPTPPEYKEFVGWECYGTVDGFDVELDVLEENGIIDLTIPANQGMNFVIKPLYKWATIDRIEIIHIPGDDKYNEYHDYTFNPDRATIELSMTLNETMYEVEGIYADESFTQLISSTKTISITYGVELPNKLYVKYVYKTIQLEFELNGGTANAELPTTYNYGTDEYLNLPSSIEKSGYTFAGFETADGTLAKHLNYQSIYQLASDGKLVLYAKWI